MVTGMMMDTGSHRQKKQKAKEVQESAMHGLQCRKMTSSYPLMVWAKKHLQSSEPHLDSVFRRR